MISSQSATFIRCFLHWLLFFFHPLSKNFTDRINAEIPIFIDILRGYGEIGQLVVSENLTIQISYISVYFIVSYMIFILIQDKKVSEIFTIFLKTDFHQVSEISGRKIFILLISLDLLYQIKIFSRKFIKLAQMLLYSSYVKHNFEKYY